MHEKRALTAYELIDELSNIPGNTVITWTEWDFDRYATFVYGISGVHESGALQYEGILESYDGMAEDDEA